MDGDIAADLDRWRLSRSWTWTWNLWMEVAA